ncbi:MAG: FAD-dependent oxidoreductase [Halioglobus sp.]
MHYNHLLSPGRIAGLNLRNRIVMSPMGSNLSEADGHCTERIQAYYEARARGGAGMIIVGVASVAWPEGACNPNQVAISSELFLPGLSALARRIKRHGCAAAIQLQHAGKVAVRDIAVGRPMLVPSLPPQDKGDMVNALTADEMHAFVKSYSAEGARVEYNIASLEDLQRLIEQFADAAGRAQNAGFEAVEIHAGHGYILSEFLSPHVNQREDEYGGCIENRARLLQQVIRAVKARVGHGFPVWCRIDATEYRIEGGICYDDAVATAALAEAAGADAIHVSAYANPASGAAFTEAPLVQKPGGYLGFAAGIKQRVTVPVIAVGRIEPEVGDAVIGRGEADFIAMGRKLLADPDLPAKLRQGRPEDVRPCIYCYTCVSRIFVNQHLRCAVNPATGFEHELVVMPAERSRKILVVGGGPAGMEAARVAALRGHRVKLVEQGSALGGTAFFAALAYRENGRLVEYLQEQVARSSVAVELNTTVDEAFLALESPDAVIVATGARRDAPEIPGREQTNVFSGDEMRALMTGSGDLAGRRKLAWWQRGALFLAGVLGITRNVALMDKLSHWWMPLGQHVCIIGGGLVGSELAEFLALRGRKVSLVEEGEKFAVELPLVRRWRVLEELRELSVVMINNTTLKQVSDCKLTLDCQGSEVEIEADTVILASGATGDLDLAQRCESMGLETHVAGDCEGVAYLEGAMRSAHAVACRV